MRNQHNLPFFSCISFLFSLQIVLASGTLCAQNSDLRLDSIQLIRKKIEAVRIAAAPRIDGKLDEPFWKTLPVAGDFVEYAPRNGTAPVFATDVMFAYDDGALYCGAILYDPHPDSAPRQLGRRDQVEQLVTDYLSFDILPYNDELNMYEFKVSPRNLQNDCKYSAVGTDINWDAVWESETRIEDTCWTIELRIPWSALRFPKTEKQVWGINMWRNNFRKHEFSTWSFVDNTSQNIFRYYGELTGIENIKPPLRLSFSPYVGAYVEKNPDQRDPVFNFRGGMDLKFGINESYTLDMMLIPDFGQVQSDDVVLNLTPFEIRYDEKRQFFTEGTELFDKCGIFYTRRIGGLPRDYYLPYYSLSENERVKKNPEETRIINATKISGRNRKGLGIGFFNGMTTNTKSILEDTVTGATRKIMTQPFTNYNVLVFDQNLPNNSYVTLINTNYYIPEEGYSANVSGTEANLCNKKNTFSFFGKAMVSQKYGAHQSPDFGYAYTLYLTKPSGNFQYMLYRDATSKTYDPNDMGFLLYNNETNNLLRLSYYQYKPFWKIINMQNDFRTLYSTLNSPSSFKTLKFSFDHSTTFTSYWITALSAYYEPLGFYDYYEPRVWGYVFKQPASYYIEWREASDSKRKFRYHHNFSIGNCPGLENFSYTIGFTPRFRVSDHFSVTFDFQYSKDLNNYGWVNTVYDSLGQPSIYFGRRDITTLNNILNAQLIFTTKTSLSLRVRHYWSQAKYLDFYRLKDDGHLQNDDYQDNHDINFNAFTADLQFIWYFAPGSELSVMWKNSIYTSGTALMSNYFRDFEEMINSPQTNSLSIRVLYYIDYLFLKKAFTKKG